jgi:hypothetical protein
LADDRTYTCRSAAHPGKHRHMARTSRGTAGLVKALRDQQTLLRSACRGFDEGSHPEAQNIAGRLRVLLHDTKLSHSLLGQLGVKERLPYLDTSSAELPPEVIHMGAGLCMISAQLGPGGHSKYAAPLGIQAPDREHPPQAFVDWWAEPVVDDDHGRPISRRQFVLWLANEEGGMHVDPSVDDTYTELSAAGVSRFAPPEGSDPRFRDLVAPTVRQIAYEVESILNDHLVEEQDPSVGISIRDPICSLSIHKKVTVGRNDPCPCDSGQKRKKCFDLRQPRRRISLAELQAELPPSAPD